MAKVSKNILGDIKGKAGGLVFRNINGKTFVSVRPEKYNQTKSKELLNAQSGFSKLTAFSSYVNSISELKNVWKLKQIKGTRAYNKIYSHNSKFIKENNNPEILTILPPNIPNIFLGNFTIDKNIITLNISFTSSSLVAQDHIYKLIVISKNNINYSHQICIIENNSINNSRNITFELNHNITNIEEIEHFYCGIVIYDAKEEIIDWSNTHFSINL